MKKTFLLTLAIPALSAAQTKPIQPQTPDVVVPPRVTVPPLPGQAEKPLSLAEAIAIAMQHQADIEVARAGIQAAEGRVKQAHAGELPQVNLNGGYSQVNHIRGASASNASNSGFNSSVGISQLVFDFGRTREQVRQQQALETAQMLNLSRVQSEVVLSVEVAFYTLEESNNLVAVSEANLKNSQNQLALAQARLSAGLGAPGDVVRAKTNVASAVLAFTNARATSETNRFALAQVMGIDPRTAFTIQPQAETQSAFDDVNALVAAALTNRPEVAEAAASLRAAQLGVTAAGKANSPTITLGFTLGSRGRNDPLQNQTGTANLSLNFPLYNGGLTQGLVQTARAQVVTAQALQRQLQTQITSEVASAWVAFRTSEQNVATATVQEANAREAQRIAEGRYSGGLGSFLEITDAQSALFSAQRNLETARADLKRARATLMRAIGSQAEITPRGALSSDSQTAPSAPRG